jgi:signal transduction histidine kinase/ligand-binding sensor domain-containing protein
MTLHAAPCSLTCFSRVVPHEYGGASERRDYNRSITRGESSLLRKVQTVSQEPPVRYVGVEARACLHALWVACAALCSLFSCGQAWAQYQSTQWTADSGLPQNSVRGIVQTPDGYIWVATLNGVARFDGVRFTIFDKGNTPGISNSRFVAMVRGSAGDLWLASEDGNIVRYHDGQFNSVNQGDGVRQRSVAAITGDELGNVWIEADEKVYRWSAERNSFLKEAIGPDNIHFYPLWWVGTGFWGFNDGKLTCFSRGVSHVFALPADFKPESIRGVAYGADQFLWIATLDGRLARISDGRLERVADPIVSKMINPSEGNWEISISQQLNRTVSFPSGDTKRSIPYNIIMRDNEHNLWIGSEQEGLSRIQKQSIETISSVQGLASDNVYPVLRTHDGDMWVGSWPAGLTRFHDGKIVASLKGANGIPGLVTSLAEDRNGVLWVGTHGGTRIMVNGRFVEPPGLPSEKMPAVQAIHQALDGAMLLGTSKGLYVVEGAKSRWITLSDGLATDDVRVIVTDRHGDTWIGGYGGLTRLHNGVMTRWTEAQGLPSNNVRSVMEDSAGELWVGTYDGGIGWFRNGKWVVFNQASGLYDNGAFQILEDAHHYFWISSNRGIFRVSRPQLVAIANGLDARINSISYGRADGMLSVECNGGLWPAGAIDARGLLWFPTQKGVALVDPSAVATVSEAPRISIEAALIEHISQRDLSHVVLRPGQTNFEVQYTALSFTRPEQISFRYKLDGIDENWLEVAQRRTAYYTHLPPGDYVFHVAARSSDGIESVNDSTLLVTVVPPFYRRWWFIVLVLAMLIVMVSALWHYRIRQLKAAQVAQQRFSRELIASQENERRRIAADLHDSLGQRLIIINNLALFLLRTKGKLRTEEDKQQTIEEINSEATQAIEETRAISYALRPFQLDRLGLTKAIQALIKTVARASEIELSADIANIDNAFPDDLRINVYRIVQEALNNVVKHSEASRGSVRARRTKTAVVLTISDNGKGLPAEPRSLIAGPGGFGLAGMRERATLLHGKMLIRSEGGAGTLLVIDFPLESEQVP